MLFISNFITSVLRMLVGAAVLTIAAGIPAYFTAVDMSSVAAAGAETASPLDVAKMFFDGARLSAAMLIADTSGDGAEIAKSAEAMYAEHPRWRAAGGDEPFFDTFYSALAQTSVNDGKSLARLFSLGENRAKLLSFLSQSQSGFVRKILELRKMNSTILPPVYTSAGAPLDTALLLSALLIQSGDFSTDFLKDLSFTLEKMKGDSSEREKFEKYCVGILAFARDFDWTITRSLAARFDSLDSVFKFSKTYRAADVLHRKNILVSALLMRGDSSGLVEYLKDSDPRRWEDFSYAFIHGDGSIGFLTKSGRPIYRDSFAAKRLAEVCNPIKNLLGEAAGKFPVPMLALKILLGIAGGYFFIRGLLRIFSVRRDTPSWSSPLALARGLLEGAVVALLFFLLVEPDAFTIRISDEPVPELKFAFENVINTIGNETMKFQTDTATLAAIGLFLVLQFTVYLFCVIRLAAIRRMTAPAKLKLKLLENEENLFDLGLYLGLAGTVASLVLLTLGVVTASLMAAYTSTLFGILFTAIVKIVHVRKYKRKLLIESEREA